MRPIRHGQFGIEIDRQEIALDVLGFSVVGHGCSNRGAGFDDNAQFMSDERLFANGYSSAGETGRSNEKRGCDDCDRKRTAFHGSSWRWRLKHINTDYIDPKNRVTVTEKY